MLVIEIILHLLEYPLYTFGTWFVICLCIHTTNVIGLLVTFVGLPLGAAISIILYLYFGSRWQNPSTSLKKEYMDWIVVKDPQLQCWVGKKIPIREAYEWYFRDRIEFTRPTLEVFLHRYELFQMAFGVTHFKEAVSEVFSKAWNHGESGDHGEVTPVYNLGNDFYYAFLSDPMFYSCGVAFKQDDDLMTAQMRKCAIICEQLQVQDGDRILDFGCGWGSWLIYCAQHFDIKGTGMTISQCQFDYATERVKKLGLQDKVTILLKDYREITPEAYGQFDRITCFEMSEHVGIRNYQNFTAQVKSLLKEDGLFFLQIAGLRRTWNYEDLLWGIFMGKYIFPGADASCPLYWDINQLERGGFEVFHVKNQGVHYAHTIEAWYNNLVQNKESVLEKYDTFSYRRHELFLAWSTMIARQGSSTVWSIISAHQTPVDNFSTMPIKTPHNRSKKFINNKMFTTAQL